MTALPVAALLMTALPMTVLPVAAGLGVAAAAFLVGRLARPAPGRPVATRRPPPGTEGRLRPARRAGPRSDRAAATAATTPPRARRLPALLKAHLAAVMAAVATMAVAPPAVPVVLAVAVIAPVAADRRRARRRASQLRADLPEVAELLALAVEAGLTVREAVSLAAQHLAGPLSSELRTVEREVQVGRRLAEALDALGDRVGDDTRPLAAVLADCERSGAASAPALRRLAADARERRRRDAEEAARRLPVKLLFPLVGCVLPAFALLTVVPVVAGALRALRP